MVPMHLLLTMQKDGLEETLSILKEGLLLFLSTFHFRQSSFEESSLVPSPHSLWVPPQSYTKENWVAVLKTLMTVANCL